MRAQKYLARFLTEGIRKITTKIRAEINKRESKHIREDQ